MKRTTTTLLTGAAIIVPLTVGYAAVQATSKPSPTPTHTPTTHKKTSTHSTKATNSATYHYTGPGVDMDWGTVQVTIAVKNKRITAVQATAPTERARSAFINQQAVPMLTQEVLQAQSANVYLISGATLTSEAYAQSLQSAIDAARSAHTL